MSSGSESETVTPHSRRRLQRKRRREQSASEEEGRRREWEHRNELEEANGTGRAQSPIITPHLNGNGGREQDQGSLDLPTQSPRPDVSDSDTPSPDGPVSTARVATNLPDGAADVGETDADDEAEESDESDEANSSDEGSGADADESDEASSSDEGGEADASDNPSAPFQGIRWISKKDYNEQRRRGVGVYSRMYRSKGTDALYFLDNLGEIWLVDENGDSVLGQDQNIDQTTRSSAEEADP